MRQNSSQKKSNNGINDLATSNSGQTTAGRLQSINRSPSPTPAKRTPSSKRSASSLASSLISSLSASNNVPESSNTAGTSAAPYSSLDDVKASCSTSTSSGVTSLPAIANRSAAGSSNSLRSPSGKLSTLSQAAAAASSRPTSGTARPPNRSNSPANALGDGMGSLPRAASGGVLNWAGAAGTLTREGSAGSSEGSGSSSPTPSGRSFTDSGTSPLSPAFKGRGSVRQLPALAPLGGPNSLDGGRLFKEAAVKFLEPLGRTLSCDISSTSSSAVAGQLAISSGGGMPSASQEASTWDGAGAASGKMDPARRRSKVSFHIAPKVSFFNSTFFHSTGDDGKEAGGECSGAASLQSGMTCSNERSDANRSPGGLVCSEAGQEGLSPQSHSPGVAAQQRGNSSQQEQQPPNTSSAGQESSSGSGVTPRALKSGFAWFKKLALALDHDNGSPGSSLDSSTASSTDSGDISISPVPTPKDGNSAARAVAYKQHHGYLPSPTASSAGQLSKRWSMKSSSGTPLSRAASLKVVDSASLAAEAAAAIDATDSADGAAGTDPGLSPARATCFLMPLPAGAVPVFGAAAASAAAPAPAFSHSSAGIHCRNVPGVAETDLEASAAGSSAACTPASSATGNGARPLKLGPTTLPGPLLLAVSAHLPPAMQRDWWCLSDFTVLKKLYDGYASTICKARDRKSGAIVALKLYRMHKLNEISSHQVAREVRLHIGLQHENIITLHAAWQEAGNVVLVQEFAGGGDLWSFIDANSGRLTERVTVSLVLQPFLRGLQYLHSVGIAHRDIKPENVLLSDGMVLKIADFGLSVNVREEPAVTRVGTLDYMAPEVLRCPLKRHPGDNKDRADLHYATAVDAWAVGVLAYELLTGRAPFSAAGASDVGIQSAICTAVPAFPSRMSEPSKEFITAALSKVPTSRPTVLHMLQHPWIRSFQRSCSTARAEPRTSQELGGKGRLLCTNSTHVLDVSGSCASKAGQSQQDAGRDRQLGSALQQEDVQARVAGSTPLTALQAAANSTACALGTHATPDANGIGSPSKPPGFLRQASLMRLGSCSMSSRDVSLPLPGGGAMDSVAAAAAAASVWNSDDNGLTGYAECSCL